ncbi:MAG TPA: 5-formyltetrahydrofolate cyclo-ligase [Sphingobium sp.]|uniref:5-formyltetrahydrofolate cyclo-ligase n=1 Tax=unclassified Sphingobium TaxID=2611147 RepID=UPI0007F4C5AC|nr:MULTISPECIES: 5-formyltetrahydrofolate cyclo-ligase [unclassified Sphingobium]OAN59198.1 5-formyltetrahydrofolate cyclo-ligase [Sphingobium sp. TCM1]WIW89333.1 5-formyltetrahydrofolate cyclo-ligase [Sphingobium sp. V4]HAF40744.1 5-formyltetrahydrofolate cyclo-ligase [Sphingobium sp.]
MSDETPPADKSTLRGIARDRRRAFVATLDPLAHRLAFKVLPSPLARRMADARVVALYMGLDDEAPAQRLAAQLQVMGKIVALPRVLDRLGSMDFLPWRPEDPLLPGLFRTSHPDPGDGPVTPDVIIAPLVGFDRAMNRLGQGGGYYDRAFARFADALRVGMAWSAQEMDAVPADPWDLPLHAILTEVELIEGPDL